jgi:LCP family protein required for cell wall assembly
MVRDQDSFPPIDKLRKKRPKKQNNILRLLGMTLLFMCFTALAYAGYLYYKVDQAMGVASGSNTSKQPIANMDKPMAMLLIGMDSREETGSTNTDVMMAAVLHPETKQITIVSIPRDTYIRIPDYPRGKANSFYSKGERREGTNGPDFTKEVFGQYFGLDISTYVIVDFEAFRKTVDALGGINVLVDQDMCYEDHADGTEIDLREGQQTLDGNQALDFVRYRKSNRGCPDSNDIQRNERQHLVLAAMFDQMKSFKGLLKLDEVITIVGDHVKTDLSKNEMKSMFLTFAGTDTDKIQFLSLKGEWRSPYIRVSHDELHEVQQQLRMAWEGTMPVQAQPEGEKSGSSSSH